MLLHCAGHSIHRCQPQDCSGNRLTLCLMRGCDSELGVGAMDPLCRSRSCQPRLRACRMPRFLGRSSPHQYAAHVHCRSPPQSFIQLRAGLQASPNGSGVMAAQVTSVLELLNGTASEHGISVGDTIAVSDLASPVLVRMDRMRMRTGRLHWLLCAWQRAACRRFGPYLCCRA